VLIALAWGLITCAVPSMTISGTITLRTVLVFIWSTCLVFTRTAFFDLLDVQGDRIVGRETIPVLIGEKKTVQLLKHILAFIITILFFASLFRLISPLGIGLAICSGLLFWVVVAYDRGRLLPGIGLEFLIESHLVLCGVIIWAGSLLRLGPV